MESKQNRVIGWDLFAGMTLEPIRPIRPPTALVLGGPGEPLDVRFGQLGVSANPVAAFVLGRWVDHTRNVARGAHDETLFARQGLG